MLEYTEKVGVAGDAYVRNKTLRGTCPLPATFRWEELFSVLQNAALVPSDARLRWLACEACGGSGEIIRRAPNARDPSDEYAELCSACEGYGRDCEDEDSVVVRARMYLTGAIRDHAMANNLIADMLAEIEALKRALQD